MAAPNTTDSRDVLQAAALAAAERGWHVFPLRPGTKIPAVRAWEPRATTDPDRIARCWTTGPFNVGLACGPSGLVVIDCDEPKPDEAPPAPYDQPGVNSGLDVLALLTEQAGERIPIDTHTVVTPSGGYHLYYTAPTGSDARELRNTAGTLGWKVDTRAHGGYVVAAGSVLAPHRFGYRTFHDTDPEPLPRWLVERLTPAPPRPHHAHVSVTGGSGAAYVTAAVNAEVSHVLGAGHRSRNNAQNLGHLVAGDVAGDALPAETVTAALTAAGLAVGLDPREIGPTIASGLRAGTKRPRQITDTDGAAA
jgi:hypothetical protein